MPHPPLNLGAINHAALPTTDPVRGARFYCEVLGFVETPRPSFTFRGAWLLKQEARVMIHLIHDEAYREATGPLNSKLNHLAFQVADFDESVARLKSHGVEVLERILPDYNYRQAFFRDPDGNVLEIGEWPAPGNMFPDFADVSR